MTFKDVKHGSWHECLRGVADEIARAFRAHRDVRAGLTGHAVEFFRNFLSGGLKDNAHLFKGVVTGILRVTMESTLSGLDNLSVFSLLHPAFGTAFGFTEAEVSDLLDRTDLAARREEVQRRYNGYVFGRAVVYNPWSVLSYLANAPYDMAPQPYLVSTSSNELDDLIKEILVRHAERMQPALEALLDGERVVRAVDENVVFPELARNADAVWSLLVFSGYLKAEEHAPHSALGPATFALSIPSRSARSTPARSRSG